MRIRELIIDDERAEHIARHGVTVDEVQDVVLGRYIFERAREGRFLVIGQARGGRYLALVIGRRMGNVYGLIPARDASDRERVRLRSRRG